MARVVILSGAGLSAESGISTFRDSDGLWEKYDVSVVCNHDSLEKNEALTLEFYDKRRAELENKEPNYAHRVIARLKETYKDDISIITQNIDDLFEKANIEHQDIIHLHGFIRELKCQNDKCSFLKDIGYVKQSSFNNALCPICESKLRPNIVFFGEAAPLYSLLHKELSDCELLIVIGTSGNVINTDQLLGYVKKSILNNLEPSKAINDELYSKVYYKKVTEAIDEIANEIENILVKKDKYEEVRLYLDDIRHPKYAHKYNIVRSYDEAVAFVQEHGVPHYISFDHDLGIDENGELLSSGYDFAKWLVEMDMEGTYTIPEQFEFNVHSANPVGKKSIEGYLDNYLKVR